MAADPKPKRRERNRYAFVMFHDQNPSCVACTNGPGFKVEAHHVLPRGQGGDDVVANLVGLCTSCHAAYHSGSRAARRSVARWLRGDAGADAVEYLNGKRGAFGAENYVLRLEGKVEL